MLKLKLKENINIELTFAYDSVPEGRKQEIKGPKFRRRTSQATLRVLNDQGEQVGGVLNGSSTNDSQNRFSRVIGRQRALSNLLSASASDLAQMGWPFEVTDWHKEKLWEKFREKCSRKIKVQR